MKKTQLLLLLFLSATGSVFAQSTVTWGENNTRTDFKDNAGGYGYGVMSGFYQSASPWSGTYPPGSNGWMHLLDVRHSNPGNNYAMQFSGSFFDQKLYFRKTDNWAYRPWSKVLLENPNGQVGIAMDNPSYTLDVNGTARASQLLSPSLALLESDRFNYNSQSMYNYGLQWIGDSWFGGGPTAWLSGFGGVKLFTGNNSRMSITAYGNVGVGTDNPRALFDVGRNTSSNILTTVLARLSEGDANGDGTYLGVRSDDTQPTNASSFTLEHKFYGQVNSSIKFYRGQGYDGGFLTFATNNGSERLRIASNGYVGIGTTAPPEMLSVEGTVACRRVKVTQNAWPDFVFDKNYPLRSLDSVEAYVAIHKHLQDIVPATQVAIDGLDLGENQAALLKKVEELTLYIIELNKSVKKLTVDNIEQKEKLNQLQAVINKEK